MEEGEQPPFRIAWGGREATLACHQARLRPEDLPNALGSVAECIGAGALRVEVDVTFTGDDVPVLSHDEEVLVDGRRVPARTLRWSPELGLPRLAEVVQLFLGRGCVLQVDLKRRGPISHGEVRSLAEALAPLGPNVIVGSQAHWNLRPLAATGLTVALDPSLHFRYVHPTSPAWWKVGVPRRTGVWGLRDDSAQASDSSWTFEAYLSARLDDVIALVPRCAELMVDIGTILRAGALGVALGEELARRGIALAAWTIQRFEGEQTVTVVRRLVELGVSTIITDASLDLGQAFAVESSRSGYAGDTGSPPSVPGSAPSFGRM